MSRKVPSSHFGAPSLPVTGGVGLEVLPVLQSAESDQRDNLTTGLRKGFGTPQPDEGHSLLLFAFIVFMLFYFMLFIYFLGVLIVRTTESVVSLELATFGADLDHGKQGIAGCSPQPKQKWKHPISGPTGLP